LVGKRDDEFILSPEVLAGYAGTYDVTPGTTWTVTMESGRLLLNRGNGTSPLYALTGTRFSEEGAVTSLTWTQNRRKHRRHASAVRRDFCY
jgi:hypothetical protein